MGAGGMLGKMVVQKAPPAFDVLALTKAQADISNPSKTAEVLDQLNPGVVINCGAVTDVDGCEGTPQTAESVNGMAPGNLAAWCLAAGALLVHVSTDFVFDGNKKTPYVESDPPNPLSAYGRSKLLGEERVAASGIKRYFIVRTSWLYGPWGRNFVDTMVRLLLDREVLSVVSDQVGSPTYTEDLTEAIFDLIRLDGDARCLGSRGGEGEDGAAVHGIYHFADRGACSRYELAERIAHELVRLGLPVKVRKIRPIRTEDYPLPARRPAYSVLSTDKFRTVTGKSVPDWREALARYLESRFGGGASG